MPLSAVGDRWACRCSDAEVRARDPHARGPRWCWRSSRRSAHAGRSSRRGTSRETKPPTARTAAGRLVACRRSGESVIHCSENSGPAISSPSSAWPMWAPTWVTPGTASSRCCSLRHDPRHLRQRGARLGVEVHQEVLLLERREQVLARDCGSTSAPAAIATTTVATAHRGRAQHRCQQRARRRA